MTNKWQVFTWCLYNYLSTIQIFCINEFNHDKAEKMYINFSCCYCCCLLSILKNFNILQQRMTNDLTSCEEFKIAKYYKKLEIHLSVTTHFDLKSIFFACLIFAYILFQSIFLEFLINVIYERLMVGVMVVLSINLSLV